MKTDNKIIGRIGEECARKCLEEKGLRIVKQNFSTKFGEIDLICQEDDIMVFVEVKTKKGLDFGTPEDMFTPGKRNKVRRMATIYLEGREVRCRLDMVAVILDTYNNPQSIKHYEDVQ